MAKGASPTVAVQTDAKKGGANDKARRVDGLPPIKVVGVGGAGCNAVDRMVEARISGVEFVGINTDAQALARCQAETRVRIGDRVSRGLGVGGNPELGRQSADESQEELRDIVRGMDMVFLTAGMGGGTGSGAAPVVARVAHEEGALTVAVVTLPFSFEGSKRRINAVNAKDELSASVDTLIVIPNDRLLSVCDQQMTISESFAAADEVLRQAIQGISELITTPGDINLDFADVKKIMAGAGQAVMAVGTAKGENRAVEAAQAAISSPLLNVDIHGARGVLFNVTSSGSMGLHELNMAAKVIAEMVDPEAEIIFGTATDPNLNDQVKVTLIAVGFSPQESEGSTTRTADDMEQLHIDTAHNIGDTDLPSFLRRPVNIR